MPTWPTAAKRRVAELKKQVEACNKARFVDLENYNREKADMKRRLDLANDDFKREHESRLEWEKKATEFSRREYALAKALRAWFARHQETEIGKLAADTANLLSESR